jgi:hypothetical protein
MVGPDWV